MWLLGTMSRLTSDLVTFTEPVATPLALLLLGRGSDPASERGVDCPGELPAASDPTLVEQDGRDDLRLRIAVQPGGCAGMQYQLFFDERTLDGDLELDLHGVPVVVDRMSAPYLGGATIDFTDTIEQQGFTIDNPNASSGCACGNSFCG